ncbi:MAG: hypothetical protein AB7O62_11355 [Pirellulales bacterium]
MPPPRPTDPTQPRPALRLLGWGLTLMVCLAIVGALGLLLSALFGAGPIAVLLVIIVIFGVPMFHYIMWGWWLSSRLRDDSAEDPPATDDSRGP